MMPETRRKPECRYGISKAIQTSFELFSLKCEGKRYAMGVADLIDIVEFCKRIIDIKFWKMNTCAEVKRAEIVHACSDSDEVAEVKLYAAVKIEAY